MSKYKIWVIENDENFKKFYQSTLGVRYQITLLNDLEDFYRHFEESARHDRPDLVISEIFFKDQSLLSLLEKQDDRFLDISFLIVSSSDDMATLKACFDYKVADLVIKPCNRSELLVKIERILQSKSTSDAIKLDPLTSTVRANGVSSQPLTRKEFQILLALTSSPGNVVPRSKIARMVWGNIKVSRKSLDVHICNLRKKIASTGILVTSSGVNEYRVLLKYRTSTMMDGASNIAS